MAKEFIKTDSITVTYDMLKEHNLLVDNEFYLVPRDPFDPSAGLDRVHMLSLTDFEKLKFATYFIHQREQDELDQAGKMTPAMDIGDLRDNLFADRESKQVEYEREAIPATLTRKDFWNPLEERYPLDMAKFNAWVEVYSKRPEWTYIFGRGVKYHHMPTAMQFGIFFQFTVELGELPLLREQPILMSEYIECIVEWFVQGELSSTQKTKEGQENPFDLEDVTGEK